MWWVWVLVVVVLLAAVWGVTRARSQGRASLPIDERSLANRSAAAEARERRRQVAKDQGPGITG